MNRPGTSAAGFVALAIAGALALNYPLLSLFDRSTTVFGLPLPFLHLFVVWALLIVGLAVLAERHVEPDVGGSRGGKSRGAAVETTLRRRADD